MARPPTLTEVEVLARKAIARLDPAFRAAAEQVVLRVEDWPTDEVLESMDIADAYDLTGLYDGIPLTEKSVSDTPTGPDMIWLYRRPILDEWIARGDIPLERLVAHVLVHEMAHHFGWSDDDIAAIDRWWET